MRLPRVVYVGGDTIDRLGELLVRENFEGPVCIASGPNVRRLMGDRLAIGLNTFEMSWVDVIVPSEEAVRSVEKQVKETRARTVVAFGGGKTIDVAKVASMNVNIPMVSVPTSASHDGISSPFASLRDSGRPYSRVTLPPAMIAVDLGLIAGAPSRLMKGGFGDMIAKLTSVKDWELGRDERGEYFGDYSANLAKMSAQHVMERARQIGDRVPDGIRALVEALISSGVAAGIAGSSRPCSGSEHLISHALEMIAPGKGLHGEKTGLATVMMAELHGLDWIQVKLSLKMAGCPTGFQEIGITEEDVVKAIVMAPSLRPERYTILHKLGMGEAEARNLVRHTEVVSPMASE